MHVASIRLFFKLFNCACDNIFDFFRVIMASQRFAFFLIRLHLALGDVVGDSQVWLLMIANEP